MAPLPPYTLRQLPLGGTDAGGNALPPHGEYYAPDYSTPGGTGAAAPSGAGEPGAAPATGSPSGAPGAPPGGAWQPQPYVPPPPPSAGSQASSGGPLSEPWAPQPYKAPAEKPAQKVGGWQSFERGMAQGASFGLAPAVEGLAAASGVSASPYAITPLQKLEDVAVRAPVGAVRLGFDKLTGWDPGASERYTHGREQALQGQQEAAAQHPWLYGGGQLVGAGATMAVPGMDMAAPAEGAGLLSRIAGAGYTGAKAGAAYGAGDAISEGATPLHVAEGGIGGGVMGGLFGLGTGALVEGGAGLVNRVKSIMRGARDPIQEALQAVTRAFHGNKAVPKVVNDRMALHVGNEAGVPMYLVDFGGAKTGALLRSAANLSPDARQLIHDSIQNRYLAQAQRVGAWVRSKFSGIGKDRTLEQLINEARKENEPAYRKAWHLGRHLPFTDELQRLTGAPSIREAITGVLGPLRDRGIIEGFKRPRSNPLVKNIVKGVDQGNMRLKVFKNGNEAVADLRFWDQVVKNLNAMIEHAKSPIYHNSDRYARLVALKHQLTDELDRLVPAYGEARAGAAAFFGARDAVEAGANFVTQHNQHLDQAARVIAKMKPAEKLLFQRGFASELAHRIEQRGFSANVLNGAFTGSPNAIRRIRIALGPDGAKQFEALMRIEGVIDEARRALGNSTTVQQANDHGLAAGAGAAGLIEGLHGAFNPLYLIAGAFVLGGRHAAKEIDEKVALHVAKMLLSDDPSVIGKGYKIVASHSSMLKALRQASTLGVRELINYARPSGVAAGLMTVGPDLNPFEHSSDHEENQNDLYNYKSGQPDVPASGP